MNELIYLKVYGIRNNKRDYKPKEQHKFISILAAQHYIEENNLLLYDLLVNNKVIDRNGNGAPERLPKKEKPNVPRYVTVTNEQKVFAFLTSQTHLNFHHVFPFKKGGNTFAVTLKSRNDANALYRYLASNAAFSILQTNPKELQLSFAVITTDFNEIIKWERTELRPTSTTFAYQTQTENYSSFTYQQLADFFGSEDTKGQ